MRQRRQPPIRYRGNEVDAVADTAQEERRERYLDDQSTQRHNQIDRRTRVKVDRAIRIPLERLDRRGQWMKIRYRRDVVIGERRKLNARDRRNRQPTAMNGWTGKSAAGQIPATVLLENGVRRVTAATAYLWFQRGRERAIWSIAGSNTASVGAVAFYAGTGRHRRAGPGG